MIAFLKNFCENRKLLRERNTFENKYNTLLDKYANEMERKLDLATDLQHYRELCLQQRRQIRLLKIELSEYKKRKRK